MNGKAAKMLRRMSRADHRSKKVFKSLTSHQRGKLRRMFQSSPKDVDFLKEFE
jgi:hypothetical protein